MLSPHFVAQEDVDEPAQILIGLTAMGDSSTPMQADWPHGTLGEYALMPAACVITAEDLDHVGAAQLAVVSRFSVPFGGLLRGRLAAGDVL